MRSNVLLLAIGLFVTDSVLASPCKPKSSSLNGVTTASTTTAPESATTTLETALEASSETTYLDATTTSVVEVPSETETYEATTTTSIAEGFSETTTLEAPKTTSLAETSSGTTTSEATPSTSLEEASSQSATLETTTTASIVELSSETTTFEAITTTSVTEASSQTTILETTETSSVEGSTATSDAYTTISATEAHTTTEIIITTTSEAETTTTAVAIPSFKLVASGGTVNGAVLQGIDSGGSTVLFNPTISNRPYRPRKYIIEPSTGRVKDQDTGIYLCASYYWNNAVEPAVAALCYGTPGPDQVNNYLNCRTVDGKLTCTVPQAVCGMNELETEIICKTSSTEVYDRLFYEAFGNKNLVIGKGNPGNSYSAVELIAQVV